MPPFATAQVIGNVRSALGLSELAMDRCFQLHLSDPEVSGLVRAMRVADIHDDPSRGAAEGDAPPNARGLCESGMHANSAAAA